MANALISTAGNSQVMRRGSRWSAIAAKVVASMSRKASNVNFCKGRMDAVYRLLLHRAPAQAQKLLRSTPPCSSTFSLTGHCWGNRRHPKMQKTVYRVRTQEHLHNRISLDMLRDSQKDGRTDSLKTLHR